MALIQSPLVVGSSDQGLVRKRGGQAYDLARIASQQGLVDNQPDTQGWGVKVGTYGYWCRNVNRK